MTRSDAIWELPEPSSTLDVPVGDDTVITLRRHGNPAGPRLVLSHGSGLAIDLYYPFWSLLTDDFDLIVYDLRNHGRNALGPLAGHHVPALARDQDLVFAAIDAHYGKEPKIGVYHSVSSLVTLLAPSNGSELAALVMFDPPLRKPGFTREEYDEASLRNAAMARERMRHFASRKILADLAVLSPNFRHVVPGVLELLAETTLRQNPSGDGYELSCPPEYEAQLMEYGRIYAVGVDLLGFDCPLKVIGADPTLPYAFLPTMDLSEMVGVNYDFLPDATHLLQLEQPENCVALMLEFLEEQRII
ncbi:MAG: alpha/beta hydrolase [Chloroflexi bacterium]|nr:alpha/beta hydrolase [Chloroflexota bacterium]